MLVSIVVPVHNAQSEIQGLFENCIGQTHAEIEMVIVDGAGDDATFEILKAYGKRDARITIVRVPSRGGMAALRNAGIRGASGEWVQLLDRDGRYFPNKTEIMIRHAEKETHFLCCDLIMWDPIMDVAECKTNPYSERRGEMLRAMFSGNAGLPLTWMVRREFLERIGLFDETLDEGHDWEMFFRMLRFGRYKKIDMPLAIHRLRPPMQSLEREEMRRSLSRAFLKALRSTPPAEYLDGDLASAYEALADRTLAAWRLREHSEYDFMPVEFILTLYQMAYERGGNADEKQRIEAKLSELGEPGFLPGLDVSSFSIRESSPSTLRVQAG